MPDPTETEQEKPEKHRKSNWWWPAEAVVNSVAGAVVVAFRGCWHGHLSWPVTVQGYSYRVCLSCGAKRLFDENTFIGYGPFRYDLNELIALEKTARPESHPVQQNIEQRPLP
jgi:hypothetical protein